MKRLRKKDGHVDKISPSEEVEIARKNLEEVIPCFTLHAISFHYSSFHVIIHHFISLFIISFHYSSFHFIG